MTKFSLAALAGLLAGVLVAVIAGLIGGIYGVAFMSEAEDRRRRRDNWYSPDEWTDANTREVTERAGQLLGRRVVAVAMGDFDDPGNASLTTLHFEGGIDLVTEHFCTCKEH